MITTSPLNNKEIYFSIYEGSKLVTNSNSLRKLKYYSVDK